MNGESEAGNAADVDMFLRDDLPGIHFCMLFGSI